MRVGSPMEARRDCINDEVRHRCDTFCYRDGKPWEAAQKHECNYYHSWRSLNRALYSKTSQSAYLKRSRDA